MLVEPLGEPVDRLEAQQPVGRVAGDQLGQRRPVLVGQDDEAHAVVGEQAGIGREAVDPPAVVHAAVAAVGIDHPAHRVGRRRDLLLLRRPAEGHLRRVQLGEHRRADDRLAVELAAVGVDGDPSGHVRDARVDRAGRADVRDVAKRDRRGPYPPARHKVGRSRRTSASRARRSCWRSSPAGRRSAARTASSHGRPSTFSIK